MSTHDRPYYITFTITRPHVDREIRETRVFVGDIAVDSGSDIDTKEWSSEQWKSHLPLEAEDAPLREIFLAEEEAAARQGAPSEPSGPDAEKAQAIKEALAHAFLAGFQDAQERRAVGLNVRKMQALFKRHCPQNNIPREEILNLMEQAYHQGRHCAEENPGLDLSIT